MATEQQKAAALQNLLARAAQAERNAMPRTAALWREFYLTVAARPAAELIIAAKPFQPRED
jgi:hypothetical protein